MSRPIPRCQWRSGRFDGLCVRHGRARGAHGVRCRFDGAAFAQEPWRDGCGRGGGQLTTVWCSHGIWGASRGVLCGTGGVQKAFSWPHHWGVRGPSWQAGPAHGIANPRATHTPRQGDVQHLHGAKPVGSDGFHVRGVPRPQRFARHCGADPQPHALARHGTRGFRAFDRGARLLLRHIESPGVRGRGRHERASGSGRGQACEPALFRGWGTHWGFPQRTDQRRRLRHVVLCAGGESSAGSGV